MIRPLGSIGAKTKRYRVTQVNAGWNGNRKKRAFAGSSGTGQLKTYATVLS